MGKARTLLGVVAAGGLLSMMIMPDAVQAVTKAADSFVTNDDGHPVPTKAIGTTNVVGTVGVTGNVGLTGPVTVGNGVDSPVPTKSIGTTDIAGTVSVAGGTVNVGQGNIKVTNGAGEAIPVTVTNQLGGASAPQPYQQVLDIGFAWNGQPNQFSGASNPDPLVPAGKLLVIEHVSGSWTGEGAIDDLVLTELCDFTDGKNGYGGTNGLPVSPKGYGQNVGGATHFVVSPRACYEVQAHVSQPTTGHLRLTVTGWLQDAAPAWPGAPAAP
jgi:hypothetical protein